MIAGNGQSLTRRSPSGQYGTYRCCRPERNYVLNQTAGSRELGTERLHAVHKAGRVKRTGMSGRQGGGTSGNVVMQVGKVLRRTEDGGQ